MSIDRDTRATVTDRSNNEAARGPLQIIGGCPAGLVTIDSGFRLDFLKTCFSKNAAICSNPVKYSFFLNSYLVIFTIFLIFNMNFKTQSQDCVLLPLKIMFNTVTREKPFHSISLLIFISG